jgi:GDP-L-fucose synthase
MSLAKNAKIYVAGHRGLVGSAIVRRLQAGGYTNILTRTHSELDLENQAATHAFLQAEKPDFIFLAAAKVGGVYANNIYRADFIYRNLQIQNNVIGGAHTASVQRLCFLGSTCIYPKLAPQPMPEDCLLTGPLEPTNEPYAIAKIAGLKMCEAFNAQYGTQYFSVMPTNLYGPNDNFDPITSHLMPAVIRKVHEAKMASAPSITVWGTGTPRREFLYTDDMADACVFLMERGIGEGLYNLGVGEDIGITELHQLAMDIIGYTGDIVFDSSKPDGTPRKLVDVSRMKALGWQATTSLRDGIAKAYAAYVSSLNSKNS